MTTVLLTPMALSALPLSSLLGVEQIVGQNFQSFETQVRCPGCRVELELNIEAAHLQTRTLCPGCARPLSGLIHRLALERRVA